MLVPSMTLDEIKKEIQQDYEIVNRKTIYLVKEQQKAAKHNNNKVVKYYDYLSKQKNNWLFRIESKKKIASISMLVYYYTNIGLMGILLMPDYNTLHLHTSHFFQRFNERLSLNLKTPKEIMCTFLEECWQFMEHGKEEVSPGVFKIFALTERGYCLGYTLTDKNISIMNTFLSHEMLKGDQLELAERLNEELAKVEKDPLFHKFE